VIVREHFVPFRRSDIVTLCADELPPEQRGPFLALTRVLTSLLHQRFAARIEALKDAYHPFNPSSDTRTITTPSAADLAADHDRLEAELEALALAANFTRIDAVELDLALHQHSLLKVGLEVDRTAIDKLLFFRRGESVRTRTQRTWFGLRRRTVTFTNYARVLIYATFKGPEHFAHPERLPFRPGSTIVKLFQNVPRDDLEMVYPDVRVRMTLLDKLLIGVPAFVSGVVMIATKLLASILVLGPLVLYWLGWRAERVEVNSAALATAAIGLFAFGAYVMRQFTNFKNRKILFMKALSENLYFRNLDNDAGVFHHLLDAAEEADFIETVLAYHFLRMAPDPLAPADLDGRIEEWFATRWDAPFDFDLADGVRKLREYELVTVGPNDHLTPVPLAEANARLERAWHALIPAPAPPSPLPAAAPPPPAAAPPPPAAAPPPPVAPIMAAPS
jgi:hypothetical protein